MRTFAVLLLAAILLTAGARQGAPRFVIDDEEYVEKGHPRRAPAFLRAGKLKSLSSLRAQVRNGSLPLKFGTGIARGNWRLRICVTACGRAPWRVGSYYKCPDCGEWPSIAARASSWAKAASSAPAAMWVEAPDRGHQGKLPHCGDDTGRVFPCRRCWPRTRSPTPPL